MSLNVQDYYRVLGVGRGATPDEIRAAYHKLVFEHESAAGKTPEAEGRFKEVEIAYNVLIDSEKRAIYDQALPSEPPPAASLSSGGSERVPWKVSDVLIGLALFVATQIGVAIFVAVAVFATMVMKGGSISDATEVIVFGAAQVGELLMFAIAWIFGVVKYRARWGALGFRAPSGGGNALGWVALAVFGMFTISAAYSVVVTGLGAQSFQPGPPVPTTFLTSTWSQVALIVLAVLVAPFAEETFFRGFVFGGLNKRLGFWWGAVLSAAAFAVAHASLSALVPIFFIGLILAALYRKTGSIWLCMIAHGVYNGLAVWAFLANMPF